MTTLLPCWAVAVVNTGDEFTVARRMRDAEVETWCPILTLRVRRKRMRRPIEVERAMLAGYLLVNWATVGNLETVYNIPGFHCFLRWADDGRLQFVSDAALAGVRALEANTRNLPRSLDGLIGRFVKGAAVRVESGILEGSRSIVDSWVKGKDRVIVQGGDFPFPIEFPAEQLEVEG